MKKNEADVTFLLELHRAGDRKALSSLFEKVYESLQLIAAGRLRKENRQITLGPADLVHETFLRLVQGKRLSWENRAHFFAVVANVMRHVLVDHARKKRADKRGGAIVCVTLQDDLLPANAAGTDVLAIDDLLTKLAAVDERQAKVVELRYFGGMSIEEAAEAMGCSTDTVKRDWKKARLWLFHALQDVSDRNQAA